MFVGVACRGCFVSVGFEDAGWMKWMVWRKLIPQRIADGVVDGVELAVDLDGWKRRPWALEVRKENLYMVDVESFLLIFGGRLYLSVEQGC
jgi:hypothetical protein